MDLFPFCLQKKSLRRHLYFGNAVDAGFFFRLGIISCLMDHTVDSTLKFLSEHCQPALTAGYGSTNKPSKTASGVYEVQTLLRYLSAIFDRHILREDDDSAIQMINQRQRQSVSSLSSRHSSGISASDRGTVSSSFAFAFVWAFGGHLHERYRKSRDKECFPFEWKNRSFWWDNKWNSPSHWKFFGKKGITSDVFLFSRFIEMTRTSLNHLPHHTYA